MAEKESLRFRLLERFVPSIAFSILLPLAPLGLELLFTGGIKQDNWLVTAAVLSASLMATSRNLSIFLAYMCVSVGTLMGYGVTMAGATPPALLGHPGITTLIIASVHALERLYRHVINGAPFFEFRV